MKPFFSYYGSKYRLCQQGFYPAPKKGNVVIEAFAGSATYSVYHEPERAVLIDKNPVIIGVWDYLINASEKQILSLPVFGDSGHDYSDFDAVMSELKQAERDLIGFWLNKAQTRPAKSITNWYMTYHSQRACSIWNECLKKRLASQLIKIRKWKAVLGDYTVADGLQQDCRNQTYFLDPPYSNSASKKYKHNVIDHQHLQEWIAKNKCSQIIACENQDLTYYWADFDKEQNSRNAKNRVKKELAWVQTGGGE